MVKPPSPRQKNRRGDEAGPCDVGHARWRWAEAVRDVENQQQSDVCREAVASDAIASAGRGSVDTDTDREHRNLSNHGPGDRVPKSKPEARASTGIQRHVGPVADPIKHPMADDANPDGDGAGAVARAELIDQSEGGRPHDRHEKAVRPRVVVKIERRIARVSGVDAHVFPTEQKKWRPQDVEEERRRDEWGERCTRGELLGGESHGEVADEHSGKYNARIRRSSWASRL